MKNKLLRRITENFSAKVLTYLLSAMFLIAVGFNIVYIHFQQQALKEEMVADGKLLAEVLASNARLGIFAEDSRQIQRALTTALELEGVIGACAFNRDRRLLTGSPSSAGGEGSLCASLGPKKDGFFDRIENSGTLQFLEAEDRIEFWSPVTAAAETFTEESLFFETPDQDQPASRRIIGFVGVTMDKTPLKKQIRAALQRNLVILVLFLGVGCLTAYFIVQEVTKPLNRLVDKVKSQGIKVKSQDELGLLSDSFTGLLNSLTDSFETINELKAGLEEKVTQLQREVRERRQAEKALRESEETARVLLNVPAHYAALFTPDGTIIDANAAMAGVFGLKRDELLGADIWQLLARETETFRQRREIIRRVIETGRPARFQDSHRDLYFDNFINPVLDENGEVAKVAVMAMDITESRKAEKMRQELEVKSLAQSKLASLGEIATGIAHEINQPLSFIKIIYESGLRDLKQNSLDLEELEEDFQEALYQVGRITAITTHLRTFGRSDIDRFAMVDLSQVLDSTLILMGQRLHLADITLDRESPEKLPMVYGNAIKLEQVFINLLQNSIDALADRTDGRITISMRPVHGGVEIGFKDNGPGIPEDVRPRIFEPFFSTKEIGKGTGLGLAIIYGIISEHNGSIEYQADPEDGGALFLITIPVADQNGNQEEPES